MFDLDTTGGLRSSMTRLKQMYVLVLKPMLDAALEEAND